MDDPPLPRWQLVTLALLAPPPLFLSGSIAEGAGAVVGSSAILIACYLAGGKVAEKAGLSSWLSVANYRTISAIAIFGGYGTLSSGTPMPHGGYIGVFLFVMAIYLTIKALYRGGKTAVGSI